MPARKKFDPDNTPHPTERWYTTKETADLLGVSHDTVTREIRRGHLPAVRVGSHHRINSTSIVAYVEANSTTGKGEA